MLGAILKGFTVPQGYTVKIRAGGESHYPEYLGRFAQVGKGDTLALTSAPGEQVPQSFVSTMRRKLKEAYGAGGFEAMVVTNGTQEILLLRKLADALPVEPKAAKPRAIGVKLGSLQMENFLGGKSESKK